MKKNKMMRTAAVLGVAALLTTSALSGTLAKYTTSVNSEDSARVATWGFTEASIDLTNLFATAYKTEGTENVKSGNNEDVIAPGTEGEDTFTFKYEGAKDAPEVAYNFTVSTEGSVISDSIKNNTNITWKLDQGEYGTWDALLTSIQNLAGQTSDEAEETSTGFKTVEYKPGNLPTEFPKITKEHTVSWKWDFEKSEDSEENNAKQTQDIKDTEMGNAKELASVKLKITITATQID